MAEPVDDLCAQVGCLDHGICWDERYTLPGQERCHRRTAMLAGAPAPRYNLRLAVWRAFLRRIGLTRLLPTEPWRGE
jgi:hypothetical protein